MPWNNNGENQNNNPWGAGSSKVDSFDAQIRKKLDCFNKWFNSKHNKTSRVSLLLLGVLGVWASSGFYLLDEKEQAVVLQFGRYKETVMQAGLHYHLPYPVETRLIKDVSTTQTFSVPKSLVVTGDENIVNAGFTLQYHINDLKRYLLNAVNPEDTLHIAAVSVFRDLVAQATAQGVMATNRTQIATQIKQALQDLIDDYQLGLQILQIDLQDVDPPAPVRDAYLDVQRAVTDKENQINEAEAYRNKVVEEAQGIASRIRQNALAYKAERLEKAKGEAGQFEEIYKAYKLAPDVTKKRLYLETMQELLKDSEVVIIDHKSGVLPHAALPAFSTPTKE